MENDITEFILSAPSIVNESRQSLTSCHPSAILTCLSKIENAIAVLGMPGQRVISDVTHLFRRIRNAK